MSNSYKYFLRYPQRQLTKPAILSFRVIHILKLCTSNIGLHVKISLGFATHFYCRIGYYFFRGRGESRSSDGDDIFSGDVGLRFSQESIFWVGEIGLHVIFCSGDVAIFSGVWTGELGMSFSNGNHDTKTHLRTFGIFPRQNGFAWPHRGQDPAGFNIKINLYVYLIKIQTHEVDCNHHL